MLSFSDFDTDGFSRDGVDYLKGVMTEDEYEYTIKNTFDMNKEMRLAKQLIRDKIFTRRHVSFNLVDQLIKEGYVVISWVNSKALNKKEGVDGHYVILLGVSANFVYFNDPGFPPIPGRKVTKKLFTKAAAISKSSWEVSAFKIKGR